jgi:protoheme ferro-lyase
MADLACQQAEAAGVTFARIESLNVSPTFISVLASAAIDASKPLERHLRA